MTYRFALALLSALVAVSGLQAQVTIENAFPNLSFNRPVDIQHPGDGTDRLFVVEQEGRIYVFPNDPSASSPQLFLNIVSKVLSAGNEEGLLGLAFDPDFETNGYFYVNHSASSPRRNVIARYSVSTANPDVADAASEFIIIEYNQPFSNHNGGQIAFGPDGYLYIATGDGGSGGDPQGNGQSRTTLLGKILRIDVHNQQGALEYAIPADNPYAGNTAGYREEIWAYGLRNPWRFSFDPATGRLWAGDVGQNAYEEIDIIEKGRNYGWNVMEGFHCFNPSTGCNQTGLELPVAEYGRSLGVSVTGGHVYHGTSAPELEGLYVYADFGSGRIWTIEYDGQAAPVNTFFMSSGENISSFGLDEAGELYFASFGGGIHKFISANTATKAPRGAVEGLHIDGVYPNPLVSARGHAATLALRAGSAERISVRLYDPLGRVQRDLGYKEVQPGSYALPLDLENLSPGLYRLLVSSSGGSLKSENLMIQ